MNCFGGYDYRRLAGNSHFGGDRKRSIAEVRCPDCEFQHLIVTRRALPFDGLLYQLVVPGARRKQRPVEEALGRVVRVAIAVEDVLDGDAANGDREHVSIANVGSGPFKAPADER